MVRSRWVPAAAGLAAAVVVLVGCSPHGSVAPSVAATAASPTPTLPAPVASPTRPAGWADSGEVGAAAAAVWFVEDLYPYVLETNDSATWQALSEPDCQWCASTVAQSESNGSRGLVLRGLGVSASHTSVRELDPLAFAVVVDFVQPEAQRLRADGSVNDSVEASQGQLLVVVYRAGDDWHLAEAQYFAAGAEIPVPSAGTASS